jgi:hypothetical protein
MGSSNATRTESTAPRIVSATSVSTARFHPS